MPSETVVLVEPFSSSGRITRRNSPAPSRVSSSVFHCSYGALAASGSSPVGYVQCGLRYPWGNVYGGPNVVGAPATPALPAAPATPAVPAAPPAPAPPLPAAPPAPA